MRNFHRSEESEISHHRNTFKLKRNIFGRDYKPYKFNLKISQSNRANAIDDFNIQQADVVQSNTSNILPIELMEDYDDDKSAGTDLVVPKRPPINVNASAKGQYVAPQLPINVNTFVSGSPQTLINVDTFVPGSSQAPINVDALPEDLCVVAQTPTIKPELIVIE